MHLTYNIMSQSKFERKLQSNGKPNPKYIDLLEEDKPLAGQKFVCVSFVSPEKILKQKEIFFFEEFLKRWEFSKSMEKFHQFLNFLSFKYKLSFEDVMKDYEGFVKEERDAIISSSIEDDYKTFLDKEEDELEKQFNIKHNFQTTVRGFKSRGHFASQEEAEMRAKLLREVDPSFDIFVGPVGTWLPWDPEAYKTGRVEFMEEELNQLHHEKLKNEEKAKQEFDQRVRDAKRKAIEENVKKARESGNKLTQTMTEDGELVGVTKTVNFEEREVAEIIPSNGFGKATVEVADELERVD